MVEVPVSGLDPSMALMVRAVAPEGVGTDAPAVTIAKRPRGRPRKNQLQVQVPPPVPGTVAQADTAVKRPRGRPPKDARPEASAQPIATPFPPAIVPAKRPRGRPRKNPLPGAVAPAAVPPPGPSSVPERARAAGPAPDRPMGGKAAASPRKPRRSGRRRKPEPSILNPFCPECGTYLRMFRPPRGRWRKVCPRCEPERLIVKRDYRDYIDKTGLPCKDRGKCRPERCVKALECEEMQRFR